MQINLFYAAYSSYFLLCSFSYHTLVHELVFFEAYFEGPVYVPLLKRSFELWRNLQSDYENGYLDCAEYQQSSTDQLLRMTGGLMIGLPNSGILLIGCVI